MIKRLKFLWSLIRYANRVYAEATHIGADRVYADLSLTAITHDERGRTERWYGTGASVKLKELERQPTYYTETRTS
jgi:hypothetical protein